MADKLILLIDDDHSISELIKIYLQNDGYAVEAAYTGKEGLHKFQQFGPALVLLDLMLPEVDGYEVCRQIRREGNTPIIMMTARGDDIDKIVGLELGADDYIAKPFNTRELVARIKAVLRRTEGHSTLAQPAGSKSVIEIGNTTIDLARHEVTIEGQLVELRAKEFDLLKVMAQNLGIVLDRDRLLNLVWGYEYYGDTRTVDVHVAHVREKLANSSAQIQTVRGTGYKLVVNSH